MTITGKPIARKIILALAMLVLLILCAVPVKAMAAATVKVNSGADTLQSDGTPVDGASWDGSVLTLSNYYGGAISIIADPLDTVTIKLFDSSYINAPAGHSGIYFEGASLAIESGAAGATPSLTIRCAAAAPPNDGKAGIECVGALEVTGCSLDVTGGASTDVAGDGISASLGLTVNGGTVTATGGSSSSSLVGAIGGAGIHSGGNITIGCDGAVITGGEGAGRAHGGAGVSGGGDITITGSDARISGGNGGVIGDGGMPGDGDGGAGVSGAGLVSITAGTVTVAGGNGGAIVGDGGIGIRGEAVSISGGTIAATGGGGANNDLYSGTGIYGKTSVVISGGAVSATGNAGTAGRPASGIGILCTSGGITFSGGTTVSTGNGRVSISASLPVNITGGSVRALGGVMQLAPTGDLKLCTITLSGAISAPVSSYTTSSGSVALNSVMTDASGNVYLYLQAGTVITSLTSGGQTYIPYTGTPLEVQSGANSAVYYAPPPPPPPPPYYYSGGYNTPPPPAPEVKSPFPASGIVTGKRIAVYKNETLKKLFFYLPRDEQFTITGLANKGRAFHIEQDSRKGYIAFKDIKASFGSPLKAVALKKAGAYVKNPKLKRAGYFAKDAVLTIYGIDGKYLENKRTALTYWLDSTQWRLVSTTGTVSP